MNYTKHQLIRIRDLNDKYYEILFQRRGLNFTPGSQVEFYNLDLPPVFIASGVQEPWVRLILNRDLYKPELFQRSVKLCKGLENPVPLLMTEEKPSFVITSEGVGAFFSYVSAYPNNKCKVCYLGQDKVQEEWVRSNHNITDLKDIKKCSDLYIMGNRDLLTRKASKLINTCKESYLC